MTASTAPTATWIASAEKATGYSWESWVEFLTPLKDLPHKEMALKVIERLEQPDANPAPGTNIHWWGQGVTIAFEQLIGRRAAGERCDGTFAGSVSKTINHDLDTVFEAWIAWVGENFAGLGGIPVVGDARVSRTEKWRYWRADFADGSAVSINMTLKQPDKVSMAADHTKLTSQDAIAEVKAQWRAVLTEFAGALSA